MSEERCESCGAIEGLTAHAERCPRAMKIPTVWRTNEGRVALKTSSPLVAPTNREEMELLSSAHDVCGTCVHFERAEGRKQMELQRFLERLVLEDNWQVKHLCSPLNELGICGAHDSGLGGDQTLTGAISKACDQYKKDNGRFSIRKKLEDR